MNKILMEKAIQLSTLDFISVLLDHDVDERRHKKLILDEMKKERFTNHARKYYKLMEAEL